MIDLTIPIEGLDFDEMLRDWRWLVPVSYKPIQMTKFGDWFFATADGSVSSLSLIDGELRSVASSILEYNALKNTQDKRTEWFLDGFVFRCESEGLTLTRGQCYGWRIHPMIGGKFEFENVQVFSLRVYQSLMGQLLRQWKQPRLGDSVPQIRITDK